MIIASKHFPRIITGAVLVSVLGTALYLSGPYLFGLLLLFTLVGLWEFYAMFWPLKANIGGRILGLALGGLLITAAWMRPEMVVMTRPASWDHSNIVLSGWGLRRRVIVFATGPAAEAAIAAGADEVGGAELIEKVAGGWTAFDAAVSTPELMGQVGRLGKVLGPRGLMPNPKTGTVTPNPAKAVEEIKGGKIEFRVDKHANLQFVIGKASFTPEQLVENYAAALDEVLRLKPASSKGRYIKTASISATMGPGVPVDPNRTRNLTVDDEA